MDGDQPYVIVNLTGEDIVLRSEDGKRERIYDSKGLITLVDGEYRRIGLLNGFPVSVAPQYVGIKDPTGILNRKDFNAILVTPQVGYYMSRRPKSYSHLDVFGPDERTIIYEEGRAVCVKSLVCYRYIPPSARRLAKKQ